MPPPCVIFPPRRRPAVIVWLQTADHIRQTSTVQEEQGATAAFDRARIMRFTMFNEEYAVSLIFTYNRLGIFSDLLHHKSSYILSEIAPLTTLLVSLSFPPYLPTRRAIPPLPVVSCQRLAIPTYAVSAPETKLLAF
jgi:hypothetical protein